MVGGQWSEVSSSIIISSDIMEISEKRKNAALHANEHEP